MSDENNAGEDSSRRSVLQGMASASAALAFGAVPGAGDGAPGGRSGLQGWQTAAPNELSRTGAGRATGGSTGLRVDVRGEAPPVVETTELDGTALVERSHLVADVTPAPESGGDREFVFTFRYHATPGVTPDGGGRWVEVSPEAVVPAGETSRVAWDTAGVPERKRASPERLELVWYPADDPPGAEFLERGYDYQGTVLLHDVRLTADAATDPEAGIRHRIRSCCLAHGRLADVETRSRSGDVERGELVFQDGFRVSYTFEILEGGRVGYTLDGEQFTIDGDRLALEGGR